MNVRTNDLAPSRLARRAFPDSQGLAEAFAQWTARLLQEAVDLRGEAAIAVSGGNTPRLYFAALSRQEIDWSRVTVTLADERRVPDDNPRSNAKMARELLLQNRAAEARFAPLADSRLSPEQELAAARARIANLPLPLDLVVLGMGEDGHTASWFPNGDHLTAVMNPGGRSLVMPMRAPAAPEPRLTLTARVILRARAIALHIEGESKEAVLAKALGEGPVADMPIRGVLREAADRLTIFETTS
jgi:6-phosphogluconolactonase